MMPSRAQERDGLLLSRVDDLLRIARDCYVEKHFGFLDEREAALCAAATKREQDVTVSFFGGYPDAERTVMGVFPVGAEEAYPIVALSLLSREEAVLTHRDYLGSLLGLGIERRAVGDLLTEPGRCVAFVLESVAPIVVQELRKIGHEGVTVREGFTAPLPVAHRFSEATATVASVRLDGVVAAVCRTSRTQACEWIRLGLVSVNGIPCEKTSVSLRDGDKLTVRGKGKFILDSTADTTRKGRVILAYRQYL